MKNTCAVIRLGIAKLENMMSIFSSANKSLQKHSLIKEISWLFVKQNVT